MPGPTVAILSSRGVVSQADRSGIGLTGCGPSCPYPWLLLCGRPWHQVSAMAMAKVRAKKMISGSRGFFCILQRCQVWIFVSTSEPHKSRWLSC